MTSRARTAGTEAPLRPDPLELLVGPGLLDETEQDVRAAVRHFVDDRVRPHIADWYETGTFPRDLAPELGSLGLLGMPLSGYGCAGAGAVAYGVACMELEAADSGVRSFVSVQGSLAMVAIHRFGSEEQRVHWLPAMARGEAIGCFGLTEPDAGSDPGSMRTRARRVGDDWLLDGTKQWITNGGISDVAIVWARTDEGVRGFLVPRDTPGFTTHPMRRKLSMRASVTSELVLDGCRLPSGALLPQARGLRAPLACLTEARFGIVFGVLGAARDCLQVALDHAAVREQFGRPIAAFQLTQAKLADMSVELARSYLLAIRLGRLKEAGQLRPEQVSAGKLSNVREALRTARTARSILGAAGVSGEHSVLRHASNLESVSTYEGTEEVHTLVLGKALTGIDAFG